LKRCKVLEIKRFEETLTEDGWLIDALVKFGLLHSVPVLKLLKLFHQPLLNITDPRHFPLFGDFNRHGGLFGHNSDRPGDLFHRSFE